MNQYLIFLTDGSDENCCLITRDKTNATNQLKNFRKNVKRNNVWFELREYENAITNDYVVLDI